MSREKKGTSLKIQILNISTSSHRKEICIIVSYSKTISWQLGYAVIRFDILNNLVYEKKSGEDSRKT